MNSFCTIITSDYIHYALALRKSLLDFGKDFVFNILVTGEKAELKESIEKNYNNTNIVFAEEICAEGIGKAIYTKYYNQNIDAFRWSMKPVFIKYLLQEKKYQKVIYTDCDIHFFNEYQFLLDQLDECNVLITPHWRSSDPHTDRPNFEMLYTSGLYNGGFIGCNTNGIKAMEWWAKACEFICVVDTSKGMFVDQVHLNLLPIYFNNIGIVKHKGCNVANWNMSECRRSLSEDKISVLINNTYPIVFIHFTKSTVNGITSGADALLLPYLQEYYAALNMYSPEPFVAEIQNTVPVIPAPVVKKRTGINTIKKVIKKIAG